MNPTCIKTYTGRIVDLDRLKPEDINPLDIAVALSRIPRFNGHTKQFYSVAQHCVLVAKHVPEEHAFAALLHDAAEAYMGDFTSHLKRALNGRHNYEWQDIEEGLNATIFRRFGIAYPWHESIAEADRRALHTEIRDLLGGFDGTFEATQERQPFEGFNVCGLDSDQAQTLWLSVFERLSGEPCLGSY